MKGSVSLIYLDNAATTWPKPQQVVDAIHKMLGTLEQGGVRFSPSHFTSEAEIETTLKAVKGVVEDIGR